MNFIGNTVNGYRITQFLGAGGMGEVYKAENQLLNRKAAIKILFQNSQAARFQNEAYIQASIRHENIAGMYEYCLFEGKPCIIMEYVEGVNLDKFIQQKGKLKSDEIIQILKQVVAAMAHLHQNKIIHRDIKSSNIKIADNGVVKLLDFGISKAVYTPKITQEGYIVGTTEYMAPELFRKEVSTKSDIWALGVLIYELATGYLPFEDKNYLFVRQQIEKGSFTNPQLLNPNITHRILDLIQKCLKLNPQQRPDAQQILEILNKNKITENLRIWGGYKQVNLSFLKNKYVFGGIVGLILIILIIAFSEKKEDESAELKIKKIKIEVKNFPEAELLLSNGSVMKAKPLFIEKEMGKQVIFQVRVGDLTKTFTIQPTFNDSTYQCDLDIF